MGNRVRPLGDCLLWGALLQDDPAVVLNKDGSLMAMLAYTPPDLGMLSEASVAAYMTQLNALLMRFETGWHWLAEERSESTTDYPDAHWTNPTAAFVDSIHRTQITSGVLQASDFTLTLCSHPQEEKAARWFESFSRGAQTQSDLTQALDVFLTRVWALCDALALLWDAVMLCTGSVLCTALHRTVSWSRYVVAVPEHPVALAYQLTDTTLVHAYTPQLGEKLLTPLVVKAWPWKLGYLIPTALASLPFPYRFTTKCSALSPMDGKSELEWTQAKWKTTPAGVWQVVQTLLGKQSTTGHVREEIASLERAEASWHAGELGYGRLTPTVLVASDDHSEHRERPWDPKDTAMLCKRCHTTLDLRRREVTARLQALGMVVAHNKVSATQDWLATLPGNIMPSPSTRVAPTRGAGYLLPHTAQWQGTGVDLHYGAPALFRASSGNHPFGVALHPGGSELGNVMILGPSRAGKSALIGFIMSQFLKYKLAQIFCFDKDFQHYPTTRLHGGTHYGLDGASRLSCLYQPLSGCDRELDAVASWICKVLTTVLGSVLLAEELVEVWTALKGLATFPERLRTLSHFAELVQAPRVRAALQPWLRGGPQDLFDGDHDDLELAPWTTIEMRPLLERDDLLPHALRYFFQRLSPRFTGVPTLIVLEEVRKLLRDPIFGAEIIDFLLERAKVNVSVILCAQSPAHIPTDNEVMAEAIQTAVKTWIFLPNPEAVRSEVQAQYARVGLAPEYAELLATMVPHQDYLYREGSFVRVFQLRFPPLQRLHIAASTPDELRQFRALDAAVLEEPLPAAWMRQQGFPDEADIFVSHYGGKDA